MKEFKIGDDVVVNVERLVRDWPSYGPGGEREKELKVLMENQPFKVTFATTYVIGLQSASGRECTARPEHLTALDDQAAPQERVDVMDVTRKMFG